MFYIFLQVILLKDGALGNPIDVSVPGVPKDKLSVSCDNGTVRKVSGSWEVFPKTTGKAKIKCYSKLMVKEEIWVH